PPDVPALRKALAAELPEYMVPSAFVVLDAFPLLPNGKVDRKALPEPEGRRELGNAYEPPRTEIEKQLADIWSALLRIDHVGIHDNFFELGGDSILSIQIIARAAKMGLRLTPKQVFRHQTIAELAETVGTETQIIAEQGFVTGEVPFTPIEQWFLESDSTERHHFNQSIMLELNTRLDEETITKALHEIYRHHDALRLQLLDDNGKFSQRIAAPNTPPLLALSDISELNSEAQTERLAEVTNETQRSINLHSGCLLAARYIRRNSQQSNLLQLVIHHLAIDGMGWRILLEDLESTCSRLLNNEPPALPPKTSSFKAWATHLNDYAQSGQLDEQIPYWEAAAKTGPRLPVDKPDGRNSTSSARTIQVELDEKLTQQLLKDVQSAYNTRINDVLLTALARAIGEWTGQVDCLIDLEGHGREELFDDLDVSRTLGWFTSIYPVRLSLLNYGKTGDITDRNPGSNLKAIKEQLRQIPSNGIGYGLLRYSADCEALQSAPQAEILFNYLGQFDQTFSESQLFTLAPISGGLDQSERRQRSHLLDINGSVLQGKLRIGITYSKALHNPHTIQQFADWYKQELEALIAHCLLPSSKGQTPSDFPLCKLDQTLVDRLCAGDHAVEDIYPVTAMQHGMLFHSVYEADRDAYLSQVIWSLEGSIDTTAFGKAWQLIADRHAALRTGIETTQTGEPLQVAYKRIDLPLQFEDWTDLAAKQREQQLQDFLERDRQERFNLKEPPLIRLHLFRFADRDYRFVWTYHHIVIDGWSVPVVIGELMDAYQAYASGRMPNLEPARPFGDYIKWLSRQEYKNAERFWRDNLAGLTAPTELPAARISYNPALGQGDYAEEGFSLSEATTNKLKEFARHQRLTLNTVVQGIWSILLSRYSTDEQIIFGATTSGRPAELKNIESMVGLLINALPIATKVPAEQSVGEWLAALQEQQLEARQYEYTSLVEVQGWSDVPRGIPLFNTLLVFENYPEVSSLWSRSNDTLAIKDMQPVEWTNYPLTAAVSVSNCFHLRLDYDQQYYAAETIAQIARHFLTLLEGVIADADCRIRRLPMLDSAETQKLLVDWNKTRFEYPRDLTVHAMFEAQAEIQPDKIALWHKGTTVSYAELNRRANRLAAHLRSLGVTRGSLAGISIDRSPHLIAGLLGILKAGAAYVPLDPKYPPDRVAFMLKDSGAPVLLTQESLVEDLPPHSAAVVCLDTFDWGPSDQSLPNPTAGARADDLAYVIYTSGSTGIPKGVAIEHRNTVALIQWASDVFDPAEFEGVLASTSVCFDLSVFEIFCTLGIGGRIVLVADALALPSLPADANVTLVNTVPSAIAELVRMNGVPASVITVNLAGEPLTTALTDAIYDLGTVRDVNDLYGPSEDTTYSTWTRREKGAPPTIGRPVHNTQVYLLDPDGQPVPVGVPGELYLGGAGVSRGYLHRPELTAEKYVPDPFSKHAGARLYRTGDRARYRPDGNIEFLGRLDHQVKLRGFRIELGEIETRIEEHEAVDKALVVVREDNPGDQRLVAYLQAGTENLDREQIEQWEKEQVSQWEDLWQDTYSDNKDVELGSDFSGWISSYTGEAIPEDEMRVWIDTTADRINSLRAARILEIGSGTGLVASRVAPHCERYLATDFSGAVIETLQELKDSRTDLGSLELRQSRADELTDIAPNSFDAIIINSVAQYFPDADYFIAVVTRCIEMLADGGHLFLGDLRSLPLLDAYHSSVQLYKASDSLSVANLASRIRQRIDQEEELLIDPALFAALADQIPRLSGVRFQLKRGYAVNELTRFRYDVAIQVGGSRAILPEPEILDWRRAGLTFEELRTRISDSDNGVLIRGMPDKRLAPDAYAMERFAEAGEMSVASLREEIKVSRLQAVEPERIYELMQELGGDVQLLAGETGTFNALCRPSAKAAAYDGLLLTAARDADWHEYTNDPLRGRLARSLEPLLREKIKADLPEYMMPSAFIIMEEFPLTPNGKIDRKKLPAPEWRPQKEYVAPRTETEEMLADIWADVLRTERVGIHDDFFALGGHSLLATQVISRVRDRLAAEPELRMLFKYPTIAEFAACLDGEISTSIQAPIAAVPHADGAVLSFGQQRLWFLDTLEGGSTAYNMVWPLRLRGKLDHDKMESAFNRLAERHESLRTTFPTQDGEAIQLIADSLQVPLPVSDFQGADQQTVDKELLRLSAHEFDLSRGPLFGGRVLRLDDDESILVILIHHIISDAWSMDILYRELMAFYTAELQQKAADLPELAVQYADYAIWQRKMLDSDEFARQLQYWKGRLRNAPARTELPTDRPRPAAQTYNGSILSRTLPEQLTQKVRELAQRQSTTLFVLLETAFALLLSRYAGQNDIVIGTPIAARNRSELEGLIGLFLNTLALRTDLSGNPSFTSLLKLNSDNIFDAYAHQDIPFEKLVDELQPVRDMSHSPIFQVLFTVINPTAGSEALPSMSVEPIEYDYQTAKFDLTLLINDVPDRLHFSFEYNTDLFARSTIERMQGHFENLLTAIVADPECYIHDLA
ncbi:MAG: amino acid adenylation domain-containing protein, partial [Gammaproteobacteria bacterium]